ncbi:hypothetical protein [Streptomyces sp. SP18BB07]|uniref:hypothetical protein n=1 Tax=Streptomyces sp. SP18BB07 TaxID=3002522 RepID=UPI002E78A96A|nr:hypothetical protein [Streptomyces sp. SP18BB07]MEE1764423.1 hypothetical protein [Streptomyces sp. SP18BB07]
MNDGDWQISYGSYDDLPGALLTFGSQSSGIVCVNEPKVTFGDAENGDADLPGEDGIRLGRDYKKTATITFELGIDGVDTIVDRHWPWRSYGNGGRIGGWSPGEQTIALATKKGMSPEERVSEGVDMVRAVWDASSIRRRATRVATLLHTRAGRTRRMYGRPRRFEVADSRLERQGYVPCVADFVSVDARFYDNTEKTAPMWDYYLGSRPNRPGRPWWIVGAQAPSRKTVTVDQRGRLTTQPVIVIHGPCKDPKITFSGLWSVQLAMTIADGAYVTIDPRSWVRTVIRTSGGTTASVADKLTRASARLAEMTIPPGLWTASLSYTRSSTKIMDGPKVDIKWRDAYAWW